MGEFEVLDWNDLNKNINNDDKFNRFWISFKEWYTKALPELNILKDKYIYENNWNYDVEYIMAVDFNHYYKVYLGIEYDDQLDKDKVEFTEIKQLIELTYELFVEDRYKFTIEINKLLKKFNIPYNLEKGILISVGYKTTNKIDKIYNYTQLERKIKYAEELIASTDLLDKKTALDYIVDSLQYMVSISDGDGVKNKNESVSLIIGKEKNSKIYTVIRKELVEVGTIVNEYFDIRHNEYLNKQKEKREVLNDSAFIEYLYNRVYSLLYIIRFSFQENK